MKHILYLSRVLSNNGEMAMPKKKIYNILAVLVMAAIIIPCCVTVGFVTYVMTEALAIVGNPTGGILFVLQVLSAFSMVFGILVIFSVLFFSSDREHFVTLPIPSQHLMMAKFINAYIAESAMEILVLISGFVGYFLGMYADSGIGSWLNIVSVVAAVCGTVLVPMVPLVYCAIFALVLMALLKNIHSKKMFYHISTVLMLLFAALFIFSLRGLGEITVENYVEALGSGRDVFLGTLNRIFFTVPWLTKSLESGNVRYLFLYLLGNAFVLVVLYFVGKVCYRQGLYTVAALGTSKKASVNERAYKVRNVFVTCFVKEVRVLLRTKAFANNCVYVNLIWPVAAWLLFYFGRDKEVVQDFIRLYQSGKERALFLMVLAMAAVALIASSLNSISSTSFTREGEHIGLLKFIPVPYRTQMYAKGLVSVLFTYPMLVLTVLVTKIYMGFSVAMMLFYCLIMLLCHLIAVIVGMMLDVSSPYVEWSDEYSALRGNVNTFFNMAVMMLLVGVIIGLGYFFYEFLKMPLRVFYVEMGVVLTLVVIGLFVGGKMYVVERMRRL